MSHVLSRKTNWTKCLPKRSEIMLQQIVISSSHSFDFKEFTQLLGEKNMVLSISPEVIPNAWGFYRAGSSSTLFTLERGEKEYYLSMDSMATYNDYAFFPYLVDSLHTYLCDQPYLSEEGGNALQTFNEEWTEECIGEEVAYLKCLLSIGQKYYFELPISEGFPYISEQLLNQYGVTVHSSTPRIYGYIQYMLKHNLVPSDIEREEISCEEEYIDVPQHRSIGTVVSWQTDGSETTESYAKEDVELLLKIAIDHKAGKRVPGVVLNDIGTIYEHGLGITKNIPEAIRWYNEAIQQGDRYYAPTNLGDIYRQGTAPEGKILSMALAAYRQSEDPYAWYRIGQSYEEGWIDTPNLGEAMEWYHKAAEVGHHLAKKRLNIK